MEVPQGMVTKLDGTEKNNWMKCVLDAVRKETNPQFEIMMKRIQALEETVSFGMISAEEFHRKEKECEKLKKEKEATEKRLERVLANAMKSHKFSENLIDPCRETAVLEMYDRLMRHEWEQLKCSARDAGFQMTNEESSSIIKAVFGKCEEDLLQKMHLIFELLEIPFSNEIKSLFDSEQLLPQPVRDIKTYLKNFYLTSKKDFYRSKSTPTLPPDVQKFEPLVEFTAECYKIYYLLLLQNPPIRAMWYIRCEKTSAYGEHVDKKDVDDCMQLKFLWPVLACETNVVRKGVFYD